MTMFIFCCLAFVGMGIAGGLTSWADSRRAGDNAYLSPWRDADREPGDLQ